ncbi:hypothetical protein BLA50215_07788 [Burkholderia lata]|uniref:DUF2827 domain-containing protein n=1 Tax=Burkholderia lata (strain ATCC 17760 / DSM 23089 / LMG 22485 / NCIMB 9086 / R18194 / 383) TaxID=482957 RepID=UPI0014542257|nr:DUF2827 domain-containing protein [Burkholderia lata]VWD64009.1 hypothetical protein BLA50215_07788 [Burkholderia lata]
MRQGKLKVGVTIFLRPGQQSIWENGIFQNCFFLIMLLQRSPLVSEAYLINGGDGDPDNAKKFLALAPAPVLDLNTAHAELDIVIQMSAQLSPDWVRGFQSRGGRVVAVQVANDYVIDIERMMFDRSAGLLMSGSPYDVVWTIPEYERSCVGYYEAGLRAPVRIMQHLWSPVLLERSIQAKGGDVAFGYVPGRERWRLGIFEPNICMVKTSHVAMLVVDVAHRQDPHFIEHLRVFNSLHLKEHATFVGFARSLDLVRHGNATFEGRFPIYEALTQTVDAVVAHHWENGQNYLYYEALYGGYPLIHNSTFLDDCGYYYSHFDCVDGALALRQAFVEHDRRLSDYRAQANAFLAKLNPESQENVMAYTLALEEIL